jgi:hypothetical protein
VSTNKKLHSSKEKKVALQFVVEPQILVNHKQQVFLIKKILAFVLILINSARRVEELLRNSCSKKICVVNFFCVYKLKYLIYHMVGMKERKKEVFVIVIG